MADHSIDARRLLCPMPVIRLQGAVSKAISGETIEIVCTDPGTRSDIPAWCRVHQHEIVDQREIEDEFRFIVLKS
ncbi:MAG: sulfurtransferase TusA family protein [Pseudomonadota bacterium]